MKKRISVVLLAVVLLLTCASCGGAKKTPGVNTSGEAFSGEANMEESVHWRLYKDGEMVFSGTGEFLYSTHNLMEKDILQITFSSGITALCSSDSPFLNSSFSDCVNLASVYLPTSVTEIDANIFNDCSALTDVYYEGTQEQWNAMKIDSSNNSLLNAKIHYESWESK